MNKKEFIFRQIIDSKQSMNIATIGLYISGIAMLLLSVFAANSFLPATATVLFMGFYIKKSMHSNQRKIFIFRFIKEYPKENFEETLIAYEKLIIYGKELDLEKLKKFNKNYESRDF